MCGLEQNLRRVRVDLGLDFVSTHVHLACA